MTERRHAAASRRFIISCAARSGSTMLMFLLRSHPDVLSHDEVFNPDKIGGLDGKWMDLRKRDPSLNDALWKLRHRDVQTFLRRIVFDAQRHDVVGFKFKTDEAFRPAWADVRDAIARDHAIQVIHLRRRDMLAQYVSHQVVLRQNVPTVMTEGEATIEPFRIDIEAALRYAADVRDRDERAMRLYGSHPSINVEYESLDHELLCDFLGVERRRLTTPTRKIIERRDELIVNLDETLKAFERYGFATS